MTDTNAAALARIEQMANAWEQRLPDTIRTATVVEALRTVLARATPPPPADRAAPTEWIDGHPRLEAVAAAVWEQCGRSDSGTCVEDDPRNIAVAALSAVPEPVDRSTDACVCRDNPAFTAEIGYPVRCPHCPPGTGGIPPTHWTKHVQRHHPEACPAVPPPADRAALRDRIAEALARLDAEKWGVEIPAKDHPFWQMYLMQADAVLAELPEPNGRDAVEAGAAERIRRELVCCDLYARVNDAQELTFKQARQSRDWHDLCYWGEASARLAEGRLDRKHDEARPAAAARPDDTNGG